MGTRFKAAIVDLIDDIGRLPPATASLQPMRPDLWMTAVVLGVLAVFSAAINSAIADDLLKRCSNQEDYSADDRIASCTAFLRHRYQSQDERFEAYYDRGTAYYNKQLWDAAIEDYTKAIALRPGYAAAYVSRETARRSKGGWGQAVDVSVKMRGGTF